MDLSAAVLIHLDEGCVPATFGTMIVMMSQRANKRTGPQLGYKVLQSGGLGTEDDRMLNCDSSLSFFAFLCSSAIRHGI